MHEFSVTSWIVDALLVLARKQGAERVLEVNLRVGKLRALSIEQLQFCYDVLSKHTLLEGSHLNIEQTAGKAHCNSCGYAGEFDPNGDEYHFGLPLLVCPTCGGSLFVEGGDECVIARVRLEIPSSTEPHVVP